MVLHSAQFDHGNTKQTISPGTLLLSCFEYNPQFTVTQPSSLKSKFRLTSTFNKCTVFLYC